MPHAPTQPAFDDQRFLAIRSLLVELAASLDRTERHASVGTASLTTDPRWKLVVAAIERLARGQGRAEDLQMLFSDPYEATWRRDGGPTLAGSPGCCGR